MARDAPNDCRLFIIGNKIDLEPAVSRSEALDWAAKHHVRCFFVSALTGDGIQELFREITLCLPTSRFTPVVQQMPQSESTEQHCC